MTKLRTFLPVYRSERGMTQEELANRVGVRRETISRLEKGQYNPSLKLAMDIAAVFSLPVESLFFFYDDGQPLEKIKTTSKLVVCSGPRRANYLLAPLRGTEGLLSHHYFQAATIKWLFFCLLTLVTRKRVYIFFE